MDVVFLHLFNIGIMAGWLVLAVLLLRLCLRRCPRWVLCLLWGIVGLRLMMPFSPKSVFSLVPSEQTIPEQIMYEQQPVIDSGIEVIDNVVNPVISDSLAPSVYDSVNPVQIVIFVASRIWAAGMAVMLVYLLASYVCLYRRVRMATLLKDNIRQSENVASPFILGVFRPMIYVPYELEESDFEHVIAHEKAHLARRDHLIKPFAYLILMVYWFQPLLWVAYVLLCRDIELACDEKVIREMNPEQRKSYSRALLNCSMNRKRIAACPVAFGEVGIKERVKNVKAYQKPGFWLVLIAVLVCMVTAVCFLTGPKDEEQKGPDGSETPTGAPEGELDQPQIMYGGRIYYYYATGFGEITTLPSDCILVGEIKMVNNSKTPSEDFMGACVEAGQQIFKREQENVLYVRYDTGYARFYEDYSQIEKQRQQQKFAEVLKDIYYKHTYPDGTDIGYDDFFDFSENQFAVWDVDGDGREELMVRFVTTFMASMAETVYEYESYTDTVRVELRQFPLLTFYDNGVVKAGLSHNQGLAGENFWPYMVYRYDRTTDTYEYVAMIDAWDKSYAPVDYDGNSFPDEIDKNHHGMVYYIVEGESYGEPVDMETYEAWHAALIGGAEVINLPYVPFTPENIAEKYFP